MVRSIDAEWIELLSKQCRYLKFQEISTLESEIGMECISQK